MAFDHPVGPSVNMASTSKALYFFNETFGNDVMEHMVQETNVYASQNPASERYKWYSTTVTEMYLFLGIIIAMGVHKLPFVYDYWSSDCLLGVPGITQGIYNRPGIKCKNGRLEIASQIIDRFYFVDQIFAQFFLLDESCIYSAHVGT